jgi:RNA polymerase sigma-70 factor (ECF subfamily)
MTSSAPSVPRSSRDFARFLQAARAGCKQALGQVLDGCRAYLLFVARAHLNSERRAGVSAADLVQDTLLLAVSGFGDFRGNSEAGLLAWLRRILLNHLSNVAAKQARYPVALQPEDEPAHTETPSWRAMAQERAEALQRALAQLDADHRHVFVFRYVDKLTWPQIGTHLGRSADAVRMIHARALRDLGRLLSEELS